MADILLDKELADIATKVQSGQRLDKNDAIRLFETSNLPAVGCLANMVKQRKHQNNVYFVVNRHITHTNICVNRCKFCAFGKAKEEPDSYVLAIDKIVEQALATKTLNVCELHIVGGLNPDLDLAYYLAMFRRLRMALPGVIIKALTAVEIDYLATKHQLTVAETLKRLQAAGLQYLPGGGAEVFSSRVRQLTCPDKISGERWLEVHATAHRLGIRTNATILYGHVETVTERVEHLLKLRALQDQTGGFLSFVPLAFQPQNTELAVAGICGPTGVDDLKMLAVSRLILDNFEHIKAYWINVGVKLVQIALHFGVDDIHGTVVEEQISHAAGASTKQTLTKAELINLIVQVGKVPVERKVGQTNGLPNKKSRPGGGQLKKQSNNLST
ncbi:MAG: aminofutalosine synthase MqnE [Desulfotomaculum sp.]|nr:aminofutalosine synthase MqnE [Desulfotomaculum sp.]